MERSFIRGLYYKAGFVQSKVASGLINYFPGSGYVVHFLLGYIAIVTYVAHLFCTAAGNDQDNRRAHIKASSTDHSVRSLAFKSVTIDDLQRA